MPEEDVRWTPFGWEYKGKRVESTKLRKSLDGEYHICITANGYIYCLYLPGQDS